MLNDAPVIPDRGSYGLPDLKYGPNFGKVIDELLSVRFRSLVEKKSTSTSANARPASS